MNWSALGVVFLALFVPNAAWSGAGPERAQAPFGVPGSSIPGRQCSPQYQSVLKLQLEAFKRLQALTRKEGAKLCATLERADQLDVDKLIDPKVLQPFLTPQQRELLDAFGIDLSKVDVAKIMRLLGIDVSKIDLRQLTQQCRVSQGDLDRFATSELKRVEDEILRCGEWV